MRFVPQRILRLLPVTEPVMIAITHFYGGASMDVDNIPKPVLDALKGLVYVDDEQLTDITCRKRDLNATLRERYFASNEPFECAS